LSLRYEINEEEESTMAAKKSIRLWTLSGTLIIVAWLLGFVLFTGLGTATAQQAAPTENKGVTITPLTAVDLGPEIPGMQGRQMILRIATVEPGGVIGIHSHKDRPGVVYVIKGKIKEYQGEVVKEYGSGDSFPDNVTHWLENKETSPVVMIAVGIFKQP
jgi:quercetin dioxygenase-like cupin family protein